MLDIHHNYQAFRMVGIALAVLLLMAGCKMNSATLRNSPVLPKLSQPVRVSSGNAVAAEPAIKRLLMVSLCGVATKDGMFIAYIANKESPQAVWLVTSRNKQD